MAALAARMTGGFDLPFMGIAERLLSATSLTPSARAGRFDNFGAAIGVRPANVSALREAMDLVTENVEFGIDDARRRLKAFISNKRAFKAFDEFTSFLSDKLMRIETRTYGDGRAANYLVDQVSRKAVPAAQVDRRLSRDGVKKMFGATIEDEAVRRAAAGRDPNAATALAIRAKLAPLLGSQKNLPFNGWDELDFTLRNAADDRRYTVQGGKGWIGKEYAVASADPQENLAILARARAEGIKLVMPAATAAEARAGKLLPGMPILIRSKSAQAAMVHHRLSHETLERSFGESLPKFRAEQIRKLHGRSGFDSNVVSITRVRTDDFLQQFMRRDDAPQETLERPGAFGGVVVAPPAANIIIRRTISNDGREHLAVRDGDADAEISVGLRSLPANLYRKEDGYGIPIGWIRVDDEGAIRHFDNNMRPHNEHGPAYDPAPGTRRTPSWSLAGREMSPAEFRQAVFAHEEPTPQPQRLRREASGRNASPRSEAFGMRA